MAGEIHDNLAQSFATISMQLAAAEDALQDLDLAFVRDRLQQAREQARFGLAEARQSVLALQPARFLNRSLADALQELAARSHIEGRLLCRFEQQGTPCPLQDETKLNFFRTAQEALCNAIRHARPKMIVLTLEFTEFTVGLEVADDGQGIADPANAEANGNGLQAMRRRIEQLGGIFCLGCDAGGRTTVRAQLPRGGAEA